MPMRPREDIEQWPGPERIPFYYSVGFTATLNLDTLHHLNPS